MLDHEDLESGFDRQLEHKNTVALQQHHYLYLYLYISSSWPGTLWPLRSRGRGCQRKTGTGGPVACGSPDPAWSHRFYRTESRGSTRSTLLHRSALKWEERMKNLSYFILKAQYVFNATRGPQSKKDKSSLNDVKPAKICLTWLEMFMDWIMYWMYFILLLALSPFWCMTGCFPRSWNDRWPN